MLRTSVFYLITVAQFNWLLVNSCSEIVQRASFAYISKGINFFRKQFSAWLVLSERLSLLRPPRRLWSAEILKLKGLDGQDVSHVVPWLL